MDFENVVINRHSCRGFLQKEVSIDLLEKLVFLASYSVSSANIQPWEFHIITGDSLEKLKIANTEAYMKGLDIKNHVEIPKDTLYKERQRAIGSALFEAMSIERGDTC